MSFTIGSGFELSRQFGDFRVRFGRREFYWSRDTGWISERVEGSRRIA